jgi:GTPase SAR1 family protein
MFMINFVDSETIEGAEKWLKEIENMNDKDITIFLVGNKSDLSVIRFLTYYKIKISII